MPLLLVEDDRELAHGLSSSLAQSDYMTDVVFDGSSALEACAQTTYDLVVLDLGLPDMDGLEVLRRLRKAGLTAPVLILTARFDLDDRVLGLDAGGDDYLAKPFALPELEARIRALLRRSAPNESQLTFCDIVFEPVSKQASVRGRELALTAAEASVLGLLMRRPRRVVSKSQFLDDIYDHAEEKNSAMIEVFVSRLRRKLADAQSQVHIRALRGLGYRLDERADE
ncbi:MULTISPECIES: response regulator transcription factor [unclassified Duganella]|uniref:response regulator transcription factor n=1 Tax=unclassified Duganella TaxID=2636909 RepID=UPI000E353B5A|nr:MULTISPECIES: response regulator transcription factor [unclassified Duganella]RFP08138.1 DNA-binding response regulator [Duganella sp. BJB475]RFP36181.1 DNA-binding response regulator [Duganella sp. BJB476]